MISPGGHVHLVTHRLMVLAPCQPPRTRSLTITVTLETEDGHLPTVSQIQPVILL